MNLYVSSGEKKFDVVEKSMRWQRGVESSDVEDIRGQSPRRRRRGGSGLVGIVVMGICAYFGVPQLSALLTPVAEKAVEGVTQRSPATQGGHGSGPRPSRNATEEERVQFVNWLVEDLKVTWTQIFKNEGQSYQAPKLVVFDDAVNSGCGHTSSGVGPFYCPADHKAYIDLRFYDEMHSNLGAPGDFAQAFVIAHEVGHHIQNIVGTNKQVRMAQQQNPRQKNDLQVRMELQADCYAGVWGYNAQRKGAVERGDFEEGFRAAMAIGDDTLQKRAGRRVSPNDWTHGSAEQRQRWLAKGLQTGDWRVCDTFATNNL